MNGIDSFVAVTGRITYYSNLISWRNPPPRTYFAHWWPGRSRVFVPGSAR